MTKRRNKSQYYWQGLRGNRKRIWKLGFIGYENGQERLIGGGFVDLFKRLVYTACEKALFKPVMYTFSLPLYFYYTCGLSL